MTSIRSGLLDERVFSEEMANFLRREKGTILEMIHQGMAHVHENKLYNNETRTIYPDETLARFIGSQPVRYTTFVIKMNQHLVRFD
jgi:chromatin remodeling complex protein RSC6